MLYRRCRLFAVLFVCAICWVGGPRTLAAAQIVAQPGDDIFPKIDAMKPGDELLLYPGKYKMTRFYEIKNKHGNKDAWFTIRGVGKVVIENACKENTFNLTDCSFFRFYNLEVTGPIGGPAFKWQGTCSDMIVEDCYLHDMGGQGINCSNVDKMTRLRVSHCHIHHTGGNAEGFYLGHQDGTGSVFDSMFECNLIHDLGGKIGAGFQGDGYDINPGCLGNTFRYNVIYLTVGPGIVCENEKAGNPNIIEGNMVYDSRDDVDIQVRGCATVRDNIVMGGKKGQYWLKGQGIVESKNVVWDEKQVSREEMLKRGMAMVEQRWQEIQKVAGATTAQPMPGTDGQPVNLKAAPPTAGETSETAQPAAPVFKPEAVAAVRKTAISRILDRIKSHDPLVLQILIENEAQSVTLLGGDLDHGLQVKLQYGSKKNLAWATLEPGTLAEILYLLTDSGQDDSEAGGNDLVLSALCNTVAGRAMAVAEQLEKARQLNPALVDRFKEQAAGLKE